MLRPLILAALALASLGSTGVSTVHAGIPDARRTTPAVCAVDTGPSWSIYLPVPTAADSFAAQTLQADLTAAFGWRWPLVSTPRKNQVRLEPAQPVAGASALETAQGYDLRIRPGRITISAPAAAGRYYGVQTLRQMLRATPEGRLPEQSIRDDPALEWRGLSDDISRGQMPTDDEFARTIALLGEYKLNMYCLYIEDVFTFASAPRVGAGRARLTPDQLRALSRLAEQHHITLVPIVQTLGHQDRLLSMPEYCEFAERQDPALLPWRPHTASRKLEHCVRELLWPYTVEAPPGPWSFAIAVPEARRFVKAMLDDVASATQGPFVHIGGDEAFDVGLCASRRLAQRRGVDGMLRDYFTELGEHLSVRHGRRAIVYSDGLLANPAAIRPVAEAMTIMYWNYDATPNLDGLATLRRAGAGDVIVSCGAWNWSSFAPHLKRAFDNTAALVGAACHEGLKGCVLASWGDQGSESLRALNWPAIAYCADATWSGRADTRDAFLARYVAVHFGTTSGNAAEALALLGWQEFDNYAWYGRMYHREPQVRRRAAAWLSRMHALEGDMKLAAADLSSARRTVRRNQEHYDALEHVQRRFAYVAHREQLLDTLASTGVSSDPRAALRVAHLHDEAVLIREEFERLWRRSNRPAHLVVNVERLRRQETALARIGRAGDATVTSAVHPRSTE